jgi:hypothetical protein
MQQLAGKAPIDNILGALAEILPTAGSCSTAGCVSFPDIGWSTVENCAF